MRLGWMKVPILYKILYMQGIQRYLTPKMDRLIREMHLTT